MLQAQSPQPGSQAGSGTPMLGRFEHMYCNNILIFTKTLEEHLVHVCMVLEMLQSRKLLALMSCQGFGVPVKKHIFWIPLRRHLGARRRR